MFTNSTTIYRSPKQSFFTQGENRVIKGSIWDTPKAAWNYVGASLADTFSPIKRLFQGVYTLSGAGLARMGAGKVWDGVKQGSEKTEVGVRGAAEAGIAVGKNMIFDPLVEVGIKAPARTIWMAFVENAKKTALATISGARASVNTILTPLRYIDSYRKNLGSLLGYSLRSVKNTVLMRGSEIITDTRTTAKKLFEQHNASFNGFRESAMDLAEKSRDWVMNLFNGFIGENYKSIFETAPGCVMYGAGRVNNCFATGRLKMEQGRAFNEERKKMREEEEEKEELTALKKNNPKEAGRGLKK
jgi:hypothetical protein